MALLAMAGTGCSTQPTKPKYTYINADGTPADHIPTVEELKAAAPPGSVFFSAMVDASSGFAPGTQVSLTGIGVTSIDLYPLAPTATRMVIQRIDFFITDPRHTFLFYGSDQVNTNPPTALLGSLNGRYRIPGGGIGIIFLGSFENGGFSGGLTFPFGATIGSNLEARYLVLKSTNTGANGDYATVHGYIF